MAIDVLNGVSAWARSASRSEPGLPLGRRQSGREVSGELAGYAIELQLVHAALDHDVAPMVGQIGMQRFEVGNGGMNVAVDAAWFDNGHAEFPEELCLARRIRRRGVTVQWVAARHECRLHDDA